MDEQDLRQDELDDALREWAARPPRREPAEAARAVMEAVARRRARPARLVLGLSMAAAVVVAAVGVSVLQNRPDAPPLRAGTVAAGTAAGEGQVLMWLDDETPLYMTFVAPPAAAGGGR